MTIAGHVYAHGGCSVTLTTLFRIKDHSPVYGMESVSEPEQNSNCSPTWGEDGRLSRRGLAPLFPLLWMLSHALWSQCPRGPAHLRDGQAG